MNNFKRYIRSLFRISIPCLIIIGMMANPVHAAKVYVDRTLGDVTAEQKIVFAEPKPVQVIFEFRTKGSANAKATNYLKDIVQRKLLESGYFSQVSTVPVEGGATLIMTMDNIPEEDAAGKGIKVGLTLGLAGVKVSDFYISSLEYSAAAGAAPLKVEVMHAIHTTIGKKPNETIGILVKNQDEAIDIVVHQVLAHGMNGIAKLASSSGQP
ncbi:MAG: hypothetical protein C0429_05830 [Sphingopyxis sp.]|nr:hypothetical protein [Sphingopyxis sp.]